MISVVVAHQKVEVRRLVGAGLKGHPACQIVGEAENGLVALDLLRWFRPTLVLLEDSLPGLSAMDVARVARQEGLPTRAIVISSGQVEWTPQELTAEGVVARVAVEDIRHEVRRVLEVVVRGGLWFGTVPLDSNYQARRDSRLSHRELEVLRLMVHGLRNRQIADRITVSIHTVEHHVTSIYGKLGVTNRAEAIIHAVRHGLVSCDEDQSPER